MLGLTFLGMLSMAINFPYVGTGKGVEAIVGRDVLTGQALSTTDRLLGVLLGGFGRERRLGRVRAVVNSGRIK